MRYWLGIPAGLMIFWATPIAAQGLTTLTGVNVEPTPTGIQLQLQTDGEVQVFTSGSGQVLVIDVIGAQLGIEALALTDPVAGIQSVQAARRTDDSVRITVLGQENLPTPEILQDGSVIALPGIGAVIAQDPGPEALPTEPPPVDPVVTTPTEDPVSESPVLELGEIVVTATRTATELREIPRSVTVISREEIEQQQQLTSNLPDILGALVPGMGPPTFQNRTRNLSLRGRRPLVLIDGVPQTPTSGFDTELNTIDPSAIERIEVVRGPSALFGNGGTGGVINLITRSASGVDEEFRVSLGAQTSLTNLQSDSFAYTVQAGGSLTRERFDVRLDLAFDATNSQFDADGNRIPPNGVVDTQSFGALLKLGTDFTDQQRLEVTYSFYQESVDTEFTSDPVTLGIPGLQPAVAQRIGSLDFDEPPRQTNHIINLIYRHENVVGSQLDVQLYYRDLVLSQDFSDIRSNPNLPEFFPKIFQTNLDSLEWGGRLQLNTPLGSTANLIWGVDYAFEENERPLLVLDPDILDAQNTLRVVRRTTQTPFYELEKLGVFGQAQWDISDQWQVSGGIRYDSFSFEVDDYELAFAPPPNTRRGGSGDADNVSLNAGILYRATPEVSFYTSFAQGFSLPDLGLGLSRLGPDADVSTDLLLEPIQVDNYEIGVRADLPQMQTSLAAFYNESELGSNLVVGSDGITQLQRAPQRNYGLEAAVDWQPTTTWRLGGTFTWNDGESDADDDGNFLALSSVQVQPYKLGIYIENDTTSTWLNRLQMLAVGNRQQAIEDDVDGFGIEGYVTLDLISRLQLDTGSVTLGISNLLNNQYLPVSSQERIGATEGRRFAAPGRAVSLTYAIEF